MEMCRHEDFRAINATLQEVLEYATEEPGAIDAVESKS